MQTRLMKTLKVILRSRYKSCSNYIIPHSVRFVQLYLAISIYRFILYILKFTAFVYNLFQIIYVYLSDIRQYMIFTHDKPY